MLARLLVPAARPDEVNGGALLVAGFRRRAKVSRFDIPAVRAMRARLDTLMKAAGTGARGDSLAALDAKLATLAGTGGGRFGGGGRGGAVAGGPTLASLNGQLGGLYGIVEGMDTAPTTQATAAVAAAERALTPLLARWSGLKRGGDALIGR